jgi:hypothetical protein
MSNSTAAGGFVFTVETVKNGVVIDTEVVHNLWPTEGINHMLNAEFKGGAQASTWYVGLFEGNYTPTIADVASTFPALATECITYVEATRPVWTSGSVVSGNVNNSASKAEFTSSANKTIYGGFLTSAAAKGATSGVLGSIVRFASPKAFDADTVLRVSAGLTLVSA